MVLGRSRNPEPCSELCRQKHPCHKQAVAMSEGSLQTPCVLHVVLRAGEQLGPALSGPCSPPGILLERGEKLSVGPGVSSAAQPCACAACSSFPAVPPVSGT